MELADAKKNIQTLSKTLATKSVSQVENQKIKIKFPFNICVLGEVSETSQIRKDLNNYFEKFGVNATKWSIDFFNNKKLQNSNILSSLYKGRSRYSLIITVQIFLHSGKGNEKANIISEIENDKYIPHCVGCNPKDLLTPRKVMKVIDEFVRKPRP